MKRWALPSMLAVVAVVVLLVWRPWDRSGQNVSSDLVAENQQLRAELERLRSQAVAREAEEDDEDDAAPRVSAPAARKAQPSTPASQIETTEALRDSLAATQRTVDELQLRTADLQAQLEKAKQEERRLAASELILKDQVATLKSQAESTAAELTRRSDQVARLEAAVRKSSSDAAGAVSKSAQLQQLTKEIQDLHRRREAQMTTILSRYRDLTEQYRTLANLFESRRGPEGAPGPATVNVMPELSRIQSTIGMVEEDLRQLNSFSAQAQQLQKKLAAQ